MGHWPADVIFVVEESRGERDSTLGNDFRDEDHAPAGFTAVGAQDVKTEIDLFEIGVKGNRNGSEKFCAAELEPDQAYICLAIEGIEFRAGRNVFLEAGWIHFVIQHQKISPLRGKKYFFIASHRDFANRHSSCQEFLSGFLRPPWRGGRWHRARD